MRNEIEAVMHGMLCLFLSEIKHADRQDPPDYKRRNRATYQAIEWANLIGYEAGFAFDPNEPDWPVAMIKLPTGQVSWHVPKFPDPWDGHTTEEKYERIDDYINQYDLTVHKDDDRARRIVREMHAKTSCP